MSGYELKELGLTVHRRLGMKEDIYGDVHGGESERVPWHGTYSVKVSVANL